jgi:hypothetical protein
LELKDKKMRKINELLHENTKAKSVPNLKAGNEEGA